MRRLRLDLHVHSHYSYDSPQSLASLVRTVQAKGLDGIALTDHDVLDGALALQAISPPFIVIPGEEIRTTAGEVTGLFLREPIPRRLSPQETVRRIHAQGGLVYVPHPLARGVPSRLHRAALEAIWPHVDILEVFNSRAPLAVDERAAAQLAKAHGLPVGGGSDGHFPFEVGQGWVEIDPFTTPHEFLHNLRQARVVGVRKTPYPVAGLSLLLKWLKLARQRLAPATPFTYGRG